MAQSIITSDSTATDSAYATPSWRAAILAGLVGGAAFMMLEILLVMVVGQSPWAPPRMIAAMALGPDVLPPPATFDFGMLMVAMLIHFPLAIIYGLLIGWIVQRATVQSLAGTVVAGAMIGLAIYLVNFYAVTSIAFEWFAMARNWVSVVSHMMFGLVTAWAYRALLKRRDGTFTR